jgi:hypothetical protein
MRLGLKVTRMADKASHSLAIAPAQEPGSDLAQTDRIVTCTRCGEVNRSWLFAEISHRPAGNWFYNLVCSFCGLRHTLILYHSPGDNPERG